MKSLFIKEISKIKKIKKNLENALKLKIEIINHEVRISNEDEVKEYIAFRVMEALKLGFNLNAALKLKNQDCMLEIINMKKYLKQSRLSTVKGRIIGKHGRSLEILSELTDCDISIKGYDIGIIGKTYDIKFALNALLSLIHGSPHSKVYSYLERSKPIREMKEIENEIDYNAELL